MLTIDLLGTFAFHVTTLAEAEPGDTFGLGFPNVLVRVDVEESPGGPIFYFTDQNKHPGRLTGPKPKEARLPGNKYGAIQYYANLCAQAFNADKARIVELIDEFDERCEKYQHTDTSKAWDLLYNIRRILEGEEHESTQEFLKAGLDLMNEEIKVSLVYVLENTEGKTKEHFTKVLGYLCGLAIEGDALRDAWGVKDED